MICINNFPECGFGNKILYYFNLRQEADLRKENFFCIPWDGHQIFEGDLLGKQNNSEKASNLNFCLGEKFFLYNRLSTREVFKIKNVKIIKEKSCGIHFRGTDFHIWNPDSILDAGYYLNAIEEIINFVDIFYLFTDQKSLNSYQKVLNYLKTKNNIKVVEGENISNRNYFIEDFKTMSECDILISSPSTFCISSGFIGKNKKIIHSNKWIENRIKQNDKFWVDLEQGGNKNYSLWKRI